MTGRSNCLNSVKVYARGMASTSFGLEFTGRRKEARKSSETETHDHELIHSYNPSI